MLRQVPTTYTDPLVILGDCLPELGTLPDASVDAIVTDPPAGIGFMGKPWDSFKGYSPRTTSGREVEPAVAALGLAPWEAGFVLFLTDVNSAAMRVAKPGAHGLAWALPRTADLTTLALRLAGWEIRDSIVHLFGGGMPKSLDVSKAIDKMHGAERDAVGGSMRKAVTNTAYNNGKAAMRCDACGLSRNGTSCKCDAHGAPVTDDARRHAGKGTALSPGHEVWILYRRPLAGTVAANVLHHGTGAINIDACRTPCEGARPAREYAEHETDRSAYSLTSGSRAIGSTDLGRWPKNAVLSCSLACSGNQHSPGCPVRALDDMSGTLTSGNIEPHHRQNVVRYAVRGVLVGRVLVSQVGAAWNRAITGLWVVTESGEVTGGAAAIPLHGPSGTYPELMRWLVRLVCPVGGVVLDPFMGSGTTGVACAAERVGFIGIEQDPESHQVAAARIAYAVEQPPDAYSPKASRRKRKPTG